MASRSRFLPTIVGVFAVSAGLFTDAEAQTPRQIAERIFPSIVLLTAEDLQERVTSLGSGFFVRDDLIVTSLHVVAGASRVRAKVIGKAVAYEIAGAVGVDRTADLCVLKVAGLKAPRLILGDDGQMGVGDTVYAVGNPRGLEGTFSEGIISGFRQEASGRLIQITAAISPGSSGGPVLDRRGSVIGVAVATIREGQNLNFAVPVSSLKRLLGRLGPVAAFPPALGPQEPPAPPAHGSPTPSAPPRPTTFVVYLMIPRDPVRPEPLSRAGAWETVGTFDTAQSCNEELQLTKEDFARLYTALMAAAFGDDFDPRLSDTIRRLLARAPDHPTFERMRQNHLKWTFLEGALRAERMKTGQCIASNDPRLLEREDNR